MVWSGSKHVADWDRIWLSVLTVTVLVVSVLVVGQLILGTAEPNPVAARPVAAPTTTAPTPPPPPACGSNRAGKLVKVSISDQHMWLCDGRKQLSDSPVTTGSSSLGAGTPVGNFHVADHEPNRYLSGPGYRVFVHYWVRLFGDIGFHDSSWQKFSYGDMTRYKLDGSRGCIHVPRPAMARLYDWAGDGTAVSIVA
ncbi:L,D-transpeptidase [Gordonia sp. CPCC 205515]|uniref:L,D-transpeptidase n=1 Tax=Gordonia sp. CPCC 205515 TaxID=3140791 RepID=UPI003AF3A87E